MDYIEEFSIFILIVQKMVIFFQSPRSYSYYSLVYIYNVVDDSVLEPKKNDQGSTTFDRFLSEK